MPLWTQLAKDLEGHNGWHKQHGRGKREGTRFYSEKHVHLRTSRLANREHRQRRDTVPGDLATKAIYLRQCFDLDGGQPVWLWSSALGCIHDDSSAQRPFVLYPQ